MRYTEEIVLKAACDAYKKGDVKFDIKIDKCALRKGFAKVMDLNRIIESIK